MAFDWRTAEEYNGEIEQPSASTPQLPAQKTNNSTFDWRTAEEYPTVNNGTVQSNIVSQQRVTSQPKSFPTVAQSPVNIEPTAQPVYANNGVIQGGTSQNTYLDADGKVHFEGEDDNQIDGLDKFKNVLKAKATNVDEWLNRSAFDPNVQKQKMDAILAMETMPFTFGKLGAWGVSQLTKAPVVGKIAKPIFDVGGKVLNRLPNPLKQIPSLASEGAMWGAFDHGAHKIAGFDNENTLGQDMATGAIAMPALAGGFHLGGKAIKAIAKTKPAKAITNAYNNLLNSETPLGNTIANAQGTLADTLGLDAVNETARKYQKLNRNISRGNTALEKRFNKTDIDEVNNATGLNEEQEKLVFDRLKNGDPKKSTVTKDQEEAKEFFDSLLKEEKSSEHVEGDLSHVKSKTDVVNPIQEETPLKNDASHVSDDNDRFKIKISDDKVSEDNFFKKRTKPITREEALANASKNAGHPVTEFIPDEHAPQIKRSVYGGRVHVEKDGKPWIAYSKKKKLPSGSAEGSDAGNWYVHEAQGKPKSLASEDLYESNVDEFKSTSDADLTKEVEQAKKGKQLPSVNKPFVNKSSAMKRWNDRVQNDKAMKEFYKKVGTLDPDLVKQQKEWNWRRQQAKLRNSSNVEDMPKNGVHSSDATRAMLDSNYNARKIRYKNADGNYIYTKNNETLLNSEDGMNYRSMANNNSSTNEPKIWEEYQNTAKEVKTVNEVFDADKDISNHFSTEERQILADNKVKIAYNDTITDNGLYDNNTHNIVVKTKGRTKEDIKATVRHESQHALDFIQIEQLPDTHPVKRVANRWNYAYKRSVDTIHEMIEKVNVTLGRQNEKLITKLKDGILNKKIRMDNLDEYYSVVNNEFKGSNEEYVDLVNYLGNYAIYSSNPYEVSAVLAEKGIKDGKTIIQRWTEFAERFDNSIFGRSEGKATQELHTQRPTNSSMSFRQLEEPNDKRGKLDNEFGQFGKIQKQPNSGTIEGVQRKSELHSASRKREYDQGEYRSSSHARNADGTTGENFYNREPINQSGEQRLAPTPQSFIKSIRNSSKHQEQIKIDFDIITQDQATNRLKQQAKDGEGVYFKQGFGKANDKIDLTRNYNENRENKVGHFGEKALEGLGKRGSTKDILIETKKEEIKLQHLKDSVDFIESEFAKPIPASGKVSEGYVAVNRNLLANAVYGNKSTAWYEMMEKGEEAIKKAFKNEKVANNWIELANRNSKPDYQLPKQVFNKLFDGSGETVAEYWERYGKDHTGKAMLKTAGAILDAFNNSFKRGVLTSASFIFNNRLGNQAMIMAKSNPVEYIKSYYQATKLRNEDLPAEVIESSLLEAVEGYNARRTYTGWQPLDNFLNLCGGHTIDTSTLKTMKPAPDNGLHFKVIKGKTVPKKMVETHNAKSLGAEALNLCIGLPNKAFNKVCDKLMRVNEAMERFERRQVYGIKMNRIKKDLVKKTGQSMISQEAFLNHIKEHPELEETMVKFIEDTLGDYNNFNKFEKKVLKRVVPFYSWYRTITRHTLTLAKENPARCAMIFLELERFKEKDEDLKEWQKGSIRTGVKDSRSNKELVVNKTAQIPYSTFEEFVDESGKGGLSPAIKKPIEAVRGKQFFNDSEITSRRYMKHKKGWGDKAKQGYLDKKTGEFKEGNLPLSPRLNYLGKEALETVYPIMRSPFIKPEATVQGLGNLITNGEYKEPDKLYDADLGGYNKDDRFMGKNKRYVANDTSTTTKMINRFVGLSLQNKQPLSKAEKEALKEKYKRQYKRMYD